MTKTRSFNFIEAPPARSMRKRSPESAPRLFEWLVNNGYAEPVTTYSKGGKRRRAGNAGSGGGGRLGAAKRKKKKAPF